MKWRLGSPLIVGADQAVASLSNVALTFIVAANVSPTVFGSYAVASATYLIVVAVGQALVGEPMLVLSRESADRRALARSALTGSLLVGSGLLGLVAATASLLPEQLGAPLFALALLLPALLLQDAARFICFAWRRGGPALASDVAWGAMQIAATLWVLADGQASAAELILAWGLSGALSALVSLALLGLFPATPGLWWREAVPLGSRYVIEALGTVGVRQVITYVIAAVVSVAAAGAFRLSQVVFGPVNIAYTAVRAFLTPRLASSGSLTGQQRRMLSRAPAGLLGLTLATATALLALPQSVGARLGGDSWPAVRVLIPLVALQKAFECLAVGPFCILRAQRRVRTTVRVRLWTSALALAFCVPVGLAFGVQGELALLALVSLLTLVAWRSAVASLSVESRPGPLRLGVLSHAYNTLSTASSLESLARDLSVTLLAPRRSQALVFADSAVPPMADVRLVSLAALRLPRSQYVFSPRAFARSIRDFDLLQIEYDPWSLLFWQAVLWRAASRSRCRVVLVVKKNTFRPMPCGLHSIKRQVARLGLAQVSGVIAASDMTRDLYAREFGLRDSRLHVAPHLAMELAPRLHDRRVADPLHPRLLFVGPVVERKGVADLVEACVQIRREARLQLRLTIIGPVLDASIQRDAEWIEWTGQMPNDEVRRRLQDFDLFCMPARKLPDHEEHDGRALLEALAAGMRCAATDSGIMPEIVRPAYGLVAKSGSVESLRGAIVAALRLDPDAAYTSARDFVESYAGAEAYRRRRMQIYDEVMQCQHAKST